MQVLQAIKAKSGIRKEQPLKREALEKYQTVSGESAGRREKTQNGEMA